MNFLKLKINIKYFISIFNKIFFDYRGMLLIVKKNFIPNVSRFFNKNNWVFDTSSISLFDAKK